MGAPYFQAAPPTTILQESPPTNPTTSACGAGQSAPHLLHRTSLGIHTDGSVHHHTGAVGVVLITVAATSFYWLVDGCSTTQAELVAILHALVYVMDAEQAIIVIHLHSMAALYTISSSTTFASSYVYT